MKAMSMRRLGAALGVDPMAIYHHVDGKRELLALVTARTVGTMLPPDPTAPWEERVQQWANGNWDLVIAHRELTLAGLADPAIAAGGLPSTEPLVAAIAESGLPAHLVEPTFFIIVDAVHGAALSVGAGKRDDVAAMRDAFGVGLETIISGISGISARARTAT